MEDQRLDGLSPHSARVPRRRRLLPVPRESPHPPQAHRLRKALPGGDRGPSSAAEARRKPRQGGREGRRSVSLRAELRGRVLVDVVGDVLQRRGVCGHRRGSRCWLLLLQERGRRFPCC